MFQNIGMNLILKFIYFIEEQENVGILNLQKNYLFHYNISNDYHENQIVTNNTVDKCAYTYKY